VLQLAQLQSDETWDSGLSHPAVIHISIPAKLTDAEVQPSRTSTRADNAETNPAASVAVSPGDAIQSKRENFAL